MNVYIYMSNEYRQSELPASVILGKLVCDRFAADQVTKHPSVRMKRVKLRSWKTLATHRHPARASQSP